MHELIPGALPRAGGGAARPGGGARLRLLAGRRAGRPRATRAHRNPSARMVALAAHPRRFPWHWSTAFRLTTAGCALTRAEQVHDAGGFEDANLSEDWALGASLALRGRFRLSREPVRRYESTTAGCPTARTPTRSGPTPPVWSAAASPATAARPSGCAPPQPCHDRHSSPYQITRGELTLPVGSATHAASCVRRETTEWRCGRCADDGGQQTQQALLTYDDRPVASG